MKWTVLVVAVVVASTGCAHPQRPESRIYVISEDARGVGTAPGTGGSGFRNCDTEQNECFDDCWKTEPLPYPHKRRDGAFYEYCTTLCRKQYMECVAENEKKARELKFSRLDDAIDWIKNHKAEVALGTVVVIAGVAFIITTGGSGALILAPLAL